MSKSLRSARNRTADTATEMCEDVLQNVLTQLVGHGCSAYAIATHSPTEMTCSEQRAVYWRSLTCKLRLLCKAAKRRVELLFMTMCSPTLLSSTLLLESFRERHAHGDLATRRHLQHRTGDLFNTMHLRYAVMYPNSDKRRLDDALEVLAVFSRWYKRLDDALSADENLFKRRVALIFVCPDKVLRIERDRLQGVVVRNPPGSDVRARAHERLCEIVRARTLLPSDVFADAL